MEKRWPALRAVSGGLLQHLGAKFTNTPGGHIQTDIAASGSLAGLMLLQETVPDLAGVVAKSGPGIVVLSEVHDGQQLVLRFMVNALVGERVEPAGGWTERVPRGHGPMLECAEMTRRLAAPFYALCEDNQLDRDDYKFGAALAATRLIGAGGRLKILDPGIAKSIAFYYVVAGSKTIPFLEALLPG